MCEYCEFKDGDVSISKEILGTKNGTHAIEVSFTRTDFGKGPIGFIALDETIDTYENGPAHIFMGSIQVKFCPFCGQNLTITNEGGVK